MCPAKIKKSKIAQDQEWKCSGRKAGGPPASKKIQKNQLRKLIQNKFQKNRSGKPAPIIQTKIHQLYSCIDPNDLLCIICLETLIYPTTLQCGHTFCLKCVEAYHKKDTLNRCCLCRNVDTLDFYESNPTIQKIVGVVQKREDLQSLQQYRKRKEEIDKDMKQRGVSQILREFNELKIKVKNGWQKAKVTKVYKSGFKTYYLVNTILKEQEYLISSKSKNLMLIQNEQQQAKKQISSDIFMDAGLISDYINQNIYNLDDLIWPDSLEGNSLELHSNQRQILPSSQNSINGIEVISLDERLDLSSWMEIPLTRRRVYAPQIIEID